jgi:hypothetical protein
MSTRQLWDRVCIQVCSQVSSVGSKTRRLAEMGKAALGELNVLAAASSADTLPDAVTLEDRILLNAAPVDLGTLTVETVTGSMEGPADAPAAGQAQAASDASPDAPPPVVAHVLASDSSLLAPDLYISVNPEDRIVASYDFGGTNNPHARNIGMAVDRTGWEVFIENHLEPLLDAGVSRIQLLTPFGQRSLIVDPVTGEVTRPADQANFQFDAYLDAQVEVPKVTEDFVSAFADFFARHEGDGKIEDVIPYIGSPRLDPDQVALVDNPDAWWDRAYDIVTPLLEAGFRSIGFDASARVTPDLLDFELHNVLRYPELRDPVRDARLIEIVGDERVEVYLESTTRRNTGRTDFPLLLLDQDYTRQDPESPGPHLKFRQQNFYEHDQLTGEVIRVVRHEQWKAEGFLPVQRILLDGDVAAVTPTYFLRPKVGGADSLAEYIDKMDLPSLPTDVDLDPDDLNPETAVYEITKGPQHGTLTPNRFHGDVFTYVPNPYFTGVDSFEYVVHDEVGGMERAIVTFFVNTPVQEPHDEAPPVDAPAPPPLPAPPVGPVDGPDETPNPTPPASGGNPLPAPPVNNGPHDSDGPAPPVVKPKPVVNGTSGPNFPSPVSPPVPLPEPPSNGSPAPPEDGSVDVPVPPSNEGGASPGNAAPAVPETPVPGASDDNGAHVAPSPLDTVRDIANQVSPPQSGGSAPVLSPEVSAILSLTEEEKRGLFGGALSIELLDAPQGPTVRVQYGFGVLHFLVSTMHEWLPSR